MNPYVIALSNITFPMLFILSSIMLVFSVAAFAKKRRFKAMALPMSIVIPAYNEEKHIGLCLKSLLSSKYHEDIEVIVVDDGSTDRTIEIAKSFRNVRVLRQKHMGKVEALNFGIREARHRIVTILDADSFVEENALAEIAKPFADKDVAAVSGIVKVRNSGSVLGLFQSVEYIYSAVLKEGFSRLFSMSFGLYGAFSSYRKEVLEKIGGFQKTTELEDVDMCFQIKRRGYKSVTTGAAVAHTIAPTKLSGFMKQRVRWSKGTLQTIVHHRDMISLRGFPFTFILVVNFFWSFYSFISLPLLFYQFFYWLPYNIATLLDAGFYVFRWFSLFGPFYTLYMMPVWGFTPYTFFAVLSGIVTSFMMLMGIRLMKEKINYKMIAAVFFFFPYIMLLNIGTIIGVTKFALSGGKGTFIRQGA